MKNIDPSVISEIIKSAKAKGASPSREDAEKACNTKYPGVPEPTPEQIADIADYLVNLDPRNLR